MRKIVRFEHKVVLAYLIIGGLWILFSDKMILLLSTDPETLIRLQTLKGWFYVIVTAILFFLILRWYIVRLRKALKQAKESDMLKTAFLQNISHEIRTPMNSICGFSTLLNKDELTPDKRKHYASIVVNSSNQLLSIVNDILCISNIETGQESISIQDVRVDLIAQEVYDKFKQQAKTKNIDFFLELDKTVRGKTIKTDEAKIKQILWNLTSNALKFTQQGKIIVGCKITSNSLNIYVSDTGIGIISQMQQKVFERFVQADENIQRNYGGTGLGLTIAKEYANLLGGNIELYSEPLEGTKVQVSIPIQTETTHNV